MENKTAKEALEILKKGNQNYINDKEDSESGLHLRNSLVDGQKPHTIVLGCADSRVVPELIFDANIGELFVIRVAGNISNTSTVASIEYALAHIGCQLVVVLGHQNCGAVTAAIAGGDNGPNINALCGMIEPAIKGNDNVNEVVKSNAQLQAKELANKSSIVREKLENGLKIMPAYYNLGSGEVEFI